ncbi:MAG: YceD family protein [Pseudomonadota bacterium]|nr:YceD family protein [Pseudomonadota bacterium]
MAGKVDVLPRWVDPLKMADQRAGLDGDVPFSCMPRLAGAGLRPGNGAARARLEFDRHPVGFALVRIGVRAALVCVCQRCLADMRVELDRRSDLAVVDPAGIGAGVDERYETVALEQGRLRVQVLVEDEILLAVPDIPVHKDPADCDRAMLALQGSPVAEKAEERRENPFEVLKELRNKNG